MNVFGLCVHFITKTNDSKVIVVEKVFQLFIPIDAEKAVFSNDILPNTAPKVVPAIRRKA